LIQTIVAQKYVVKIAARPVNIEFVHVKANYTCIIFWKKKFRN